MDTFKQPFADTLIANSSSLSGIKAQNTREFLNRFNQLPSYNAIHCKPQQQVQHPTDLFKAYAYKEKNHPLKLKLKQSKGNKTKQNPSESARQKSQRKKRILNALMNNQKGLRITQKCLLNTKTLKFRQKQTVPSTHEIFKNLKIKQNIERLSFKINYNYQPPKDPDTDHKEQQRFSYVPSTTPNDHLYQQPKSVHKKDNSNALNSKKEQEMGRSQTTKSFAKMKSEAFHQNQDHNLRLPKVASNLTSSLNNSIIELDDHSRNFRLRTEDRLDHSHKRNRSRVEQMAQESIKKICENQKKRLVWNIQKSKNLIAIKSHNKLKVIRNELKQCEKENSEPKINQLPQNSYIRNLVKTSNLERGANAQRVQNEEKNHNQKQLLKKGNLISLLHPEGEFADYFSTQFNPW